MRIAILSAILASIAFLGTAQAAEGCPSCSTCGMEPEMVLTPSATAPDMAVGCPVQGPLAANSASAAAMTCPMGSGCTMEGCPMVVAPKATTVGVNKTTH